MKKENIFQKDIMDILRGLVKVPNGQTNHSDEGLIDLAEHMERVLAFHPRVGILGKTGTGKSSLCNALFGSDTAKIENVKSCTRSPQEILLSFGESKNITLVDVPGVGESEERDEEYRGLYKSLIPNLDIVLWILKADDKALATDELVVMEDVMPLLAGKPFLVIVNQVDKFNPIREWDTQKNQPGERQQKNIDEKTKLVAEFFQLPLEKVVAVSVEEKYNLTLLVEVLIASLPASQKAAVLGKIKEPFRSEKAEKEAEKGFIDTVLEYIEKIPTIIETGEKVYEKLKPYIPTIIAGAKAFYEIFKKTRR